MAPRFSSQKKSYMRPAGPMALCLLTVFVYLFMNFTRYPSENGPHSSMSFVEATSINYGISQQPITDMSQLMPKLCQNQSVICEGSYCIPGVRKCVCDLRMPVQFGRFCLRQVDIETKCFVTRQCNHTIKDAVCVDITSNVILDSDSSKFKLEQWQQLNELRQLSQSNLPKDSSRQAVNTNPQSLRRQDYVLDDFSPSMRFDTRENVIISSVRNSPYEINYNTPELLLQNHTRRRTNHSDRSSGLFNTNQPSFNFNPGKESHNTDDKLLTSTGIPADQTVSASTDSQSASPSTESYRTSTRSVKDSELEAASSPSISSDTTSSTMDSGVRPNSGQQAASVTTTLEITTSTSTALLSNVDSTSTKRKVVKTAHWPPGVCSCPVGFMFDSMMRKCLALSMADSHCQVDSDCKQIMSSHCSAKTKKCECDEPLVWNQTELACVRPKPATEIVSEDTNQHNKDNFVDNLLPPLILAKLFPDYSLMLLIFVIFVVIATLIILKLTVKCFSSSNSALISPKKSKKSKSYANNLPPRSPYATLRRPDHKPSSQLSSFTQATRGRILNYDFEQDSPKMSAAPPQSPPPTTSTADGVRNGKEHRSAVDCRSGTLKSNKGHKHQSQADSSHSTKADEPAEQLMELNDNISICLSESERKSESSILTIPCPPPNQQPPYMLASAMKGQGSAIAAAAAAVANKRMQVAQKKKLDHQARQTNGSPVFL